MIGKKIKELFGIDLRSLALMRICLGLLIVVDLIFRAADIETFYTDSGVLPRNLHVEIYDSWVASLYLVNGHIVFSVVLFLITLLFAIFLIMGFQTWVANFILWILMVSLHARNTLILTGGDTLIHLILFFGLFLPLGKRWSIDSLTSSERDLKKENIFLSFGSVALLLQSAFMYVFTAIHKFSPEWIYEGSAIYYALNIDQYATPIGKILLSFSGILPYLTYSVYLFEIIGPFLLFCPFFMLQVRMITILGFIFLQLGFGSCLFVGVFPFASTVGILPFLPSWFWDKLIVSVSLSLSSITKQVKVLKQNYTYTPFLLKNNVSLNIVAVIFLFFTFVWNIQTIEKLNFRIPSELKRIGLLLGLEQNWAMFVPKYLNTDCYYIYQATLHNGMKIDIFPDGTKGKQVSWKKTKLVSLEYKNHRWRNFVNNIWSNDPRLKPYYANYLCKEWNQKHSINKKIERIDFYLARKINHPDFKPSDITTNALYSYTCK